MFNKFRKIDVENWFSLPSKVITILLNELRSRSKLMFTSTSYDLSDIREKQKSSSKQYREKQKLIAEQHNLQFQQTVDENYQLKAENIAYKTDVAERFRTICSQLSVLEGEVHYLV